MNKILFALLLLAVCTPLQAQMPGNYQLDKDWLLESQSFTATIDTDLRRNEITLANGLIRRVIRSTPNAVTVALDNLMTGATVMRAIRPEANVSIDGINYPVGGLTGQPNLAYFTPDWLDHLTSLPDALQLVGSKTGVAEERFPWKRTRHHAPGCEWPPKGVSLRLDFAVPDRADGDAGNSMACGSRFITSCTTASR